MRGCREWAKGKRGSQGRGLAGSHPILHTHRCMWTFWGLFGSTVSVLEVVSGSAILCEVLGVSTGERSLLLTSRGHSQVSTCLSDNSYSVPLSTMVPSPFLSSLPSLNNKPGFQGQVGAKAAPDMGLDRRKVCLDAPTHRTTLPSLPPPLPPPGGPGARAMQSNRGSQSPLGLASN